MIKTLIRFICLVPSNNVSLKNEFKIDGAVIAGNKYHICFYWVHFVPGENFVTRNTNIFDKNEALNDLQKSCAYFDTNHHIKQLER